MSGNGMKVLQSNGKLSGLKSVEHSRVKVIFLVSIKGLISPRETKVQNWSWCWGLQLLLSLETIIIM